MKRSPIRKKRPGAPRRGPAGIDPERWRNPGYLKFLREEGECAACASTMPWINSSDGSGDAAHGPINGAGSKGADAEAIYLCRRHHSHQHEIGWPKFQTVYGFNREKEAAKWWARYQETL